MGVFWQGPPNGGIECKWGRQKSLLLTSRPIWLNHMLWPATCYQHGAAGLWQVVTVIVGGKRRSLLMAGDNDEVFITRSINIMSKTTEFNPLMGTGNYSAASNNMKLVQWPSMGGLLHLVQRGGDWVGPQPAQAPPCCTKCNSPPINGHCTNHCIAV